MFLLVPAYPSCPGSKAVKRSLLLLLLSGTPIMVNVLPLSPFSIYNGPRHPLYSAYVLDSPLEQPLSRSSLVFPVVLNPQLHTPCISSPNFAYSPVGYFILSHPVDCAVMWRCLRDSMFSGFDTIPACDRQTDGWMDRHTTTTLS